LTAAEAIAEPPRRPAQRDEGAAARAAASSAFASAAPTKPTGKPRISAGFGAPRVHQVEQMEQRRRRVADGHDGAGQPLAPELDRRGGARGCRSLAPWAGSSGSFSVHNDLVARAARGG
jgi:hypothetical protein